MLANWIFFSLSGELCSKTKVLIMAIRQNSPYEGLSRKWGLGYLIIVGATIICEQWIDKIEVVARRSSLRFFKLA
jgi:hypothetical protein